MSAFFVAVGAFALFRVTNVSKLSRYEGEHTYYLDATSSQSLMKTKLSGLDFLRVKGESVRVQGATDEGFVERVLQEQNACVLFTEEVCGVRSYYCYTPRWQESVYLQGGKVNLHIAVGETGCVIGYPIIFGGY